MAIDNITITNDEAWHIYYLLRDRFRKDGSFRCDFCTNLMTRLEEELEELNDAQKNK